MEHEGSHTIACKCDSFGSDPHFLFQDGVSILQIPCFLECTPAKQMDLQRISQANRIASQQFGQAKTKNLRAWKNIARFIKKNDENHRFLL